MPSSTCGMTVHFGTRVWHFQTSGTLILLTIQTLTRTHSSSNAALIPTLGAGKVLGISQATLTDTSSSSITCTHGVGTFWNLAVGNGWRMSVGPLGGQH